MLSHSSYDEHRPSSQRILALKAMNTARNKDKSYIGGSFSTDYKSELINALQHKKYSPEERLKISVINAKHALYEMISRISIYKDNLTFQESL